jgi:hypothetical protein
MQGSEKKHNIYYRVKITTVDYEHTCELSPYSCQLALKGSGKLIPDLTGLQDVLSILREHPTLDHKVLHSLLHKYVPFYQSLDGTYICNFRLHALNYVDNNHELSMVEARLSLPKGNLQRMSSCHPTIPFLPKTSNTYSSRQCKKMVIHGKPLGSTFVL